jgi:O-antigen/teichoic acid export membrane protein
LPLSSIKKLIGQTAIYGSSSIIGRFLNFLLTPLYAIQFSNEQYGIITEMYAYVAFLVVFLTYGMETAFFRFSTDEKNIRHRVYTNTLFSLLTTTTLFIAIASIFSQNIADWLKYPDHNEYIIWFSLIVGLDAISSIPLAKLRLEEKAKKFAGVNFLNVGVNILLNVFFLVYCKENYESGNVNWIIKMFYNPDIGVGYVFISNLVASAIKFATLFPIMNFKGEYDFSLLKSMFRYSSPMLLVGLAYVINETLDRAMLKSILYDQYLENGTATSSNEALKMALSQNGIYGANYKITMIVSMFIQAFRYASEPFFFKDQLNKNSKETLSKVMNYFTIVLVFTFLVITMYLHIFKYFIPNENYWEGLKVVPVLLAANICLGIYTSLSIWYKLSEKTIFGAFISLTGVAITLLINFLFIPKYGYLASAYATLACYGSMMVISYFLGQYYYPVKYKLGRFFIYLISGACIYYLSLDFKGLESFSLVEYGYQSLLLACYIVLVYFIERPKKKIIL